MEQVVQAFRLPFQLYDWMMSKGDPRTSSWPLIGSPFPMLSIIFSYIYFVKVIGPAWMKNRKPFQIERLIVIYNVLMVTFSAFFFFYGGTYTYLPPSKFNWLCEPISYKSDSYTMSLVALGWWYLLLKIAEFADTIFFVLRKKFSHITVLHVVHHSLVAWGVWIGVKFGAGGHNAFFPFINCFVHMIMYTYYCLAALGPGMRKYLWWKKYLTIFQMTQFVIAFIHAMLPLLIDCDYHPGFAYGLMGHAVLFWVMFYNFYRKAYNEKAKLQLQQQQIEKANQANGVANGHLKNGITPKNGIVSNGKTSFSNGTSHDSLTYRKQQNGRNH